MVFKRGMNPKSRNGFKEKEKHPYFNKHLSEEHKNNISKSLKGIPESEEHKEKLRIVNLGENNPMYGKNPWNKGKKGIYSEETKQKMRISHIEYIKSLGKPFGTNIGKYEKQILDELENRFNCKIVRQFFINGYFLDGYIPELNLAIEIDEKGHYVNGNLRLRDIIKQESIIKALNCNFIRIRISEVIKEGKLNNKILMEKLNG